MKCCLICKLRINLSCTDKIILMFTKIGVANHCELINTAIESFFFPLLELTSEVLGRNSNYRRTNQSWSSKNFFRASLNDP